MKSCCAGISFYRFPTDKERRSKWISAIKRKYWELNEHTWLCSAHGKKSNDPLSPDYIPSVFSFTNSSRKRKNQQQLEDYERRRNRDTKKIRLESVMTSISAEKVSVEYADIVRVEEDTDNVNIEESACMSGLEQSQGLPACTDTCTSSAESKTDMSMHYIKALEEECFRKSTVVSCNRCSNEEWSEHALKSDDQKVKFYTGLPSFFILISVFNLVSTHSHSDKFALSKFREFMVTLMKLRLSLFNQDLGYRFGLHQTTISRP